jgi:N-methylhydantoinase A
VCYRRGGTEPTVTDADLVLGRLDPDAFWSGRLALDIDGARKALATVGEPLGLDAEAAAVATVAIIDAHMCDAVRRILSLAGADPRELDLVAFGGMGAVHAVRHAALLGMRRVLIPRAAPAFSALGLLTANHVVDDARTLQGDWREIDVGTLSGLAEDLLASAQGALEAAGISPERRVFEWRLNLVYPGQTFDVAIPIDKSIGQPISQGAVEAAVGEFHRRNEEARLIEARSQEPVVRGIRLVATGLVDQPGELLLDETGLVEPIGHRRVFAGNTWHDGVPVYDGDAVRPGAPVVGPALIQSRFTTLVLARGDEAQMRPNGDILVEVAPT